MFALPPGEVLQVNTPPPHEVSPSPRGRGQTKHAPNHCQHVKTNPLYFAQGWSGAGRVRCRLPLCLGGCGLHPPRAAV